MLNLFAERLELVQVSFEIYGSLNSKTSVVLHRYRDFKRSLQQVTDMTSIDAAQKASEALILVFFSCSSLYTS